MMLTLEMAIAKIRELPPEQQHQVIEFIERLEGRSLNRLILLEWEHLAPYIFNYGISASRTCSCRTQSETNGLDITDDPLRLEVGKYDSFCPTCGHQPQIREKPGF
ncbi:hypothetical protein PJF56_07035 [Roseofilum sp. BLCC_M91]|uniref:DUF2281 domain-containing protein n=1 Tax=Roseofilum halophilum BLCC-M91 TaxID=3022259 RepID=A0ABT7BIK1_9CYAN|nr:hypothetical protein [Roseofilum halophilum]MDJ1178612.1 hypothetical protein [Roseofilum halophilum BLCC-M91]